MSFDLFVQCFRDGKLDGIPRQCVRDAFGPHLNELEPNFWQLDYDDLNSCNIYLTAHNSDSGLIDGFTVNRPCYDQRLWDALASILTLGDVVLYFPGCRAPLVAQAIVAQHLPPDLIEALGQPLVVTSGNEIIREIETA